MSKKPQKSSKIKLEYPFFSLPRIDLEDKIADFILDTEFYEEAIGEQNGILDLSLIEPWSIPEKDYSLYEKLVPYHYHKTSKELLELPIKKAKELKNPFSKKVKNIQELEKDILMIYQMAYAHYVIAKHNDFSNFIGFFPEDCCGLSGRGLIGSYWINGFLNAAYGLFDVNDESHAYLMFPFVMEKPSFKGVILVDPTSDQLGIIENKQHRNFVTIKEGSWWKYNCSRFDKNLFPNAIIYLGLLNQEKILTDNFLTGDEDIYFQNGERFLELALLNPIELPKSVKVSDIVINKKEKKEKNYLY